MRIFLAYTNNMVHRPNKLDAQGIPMHFEVRIKQKNYFAFLKMSRLTIQPRVWICLEYSRTIGMTAFNRHHLNSITFLVFEVERIKEGGHFFAQMNTYSYIVF